MSFGLVYTLLPVIAFALLDYYSKNLRVAVLGGVFCSFLELLAVYYSTGEVDFLLLVSSMLFVGLGYVSIYFDDRRFFKVQPAVAGIIAAALLGYFHLLGDSLAIQLLPILKQSAPSSVLPYIQRPDFVATLDQIFNWLLCIIVLESFWITYAALYCRQSVWVFVNAFGIWVLGGFAILFWACYLLIK